MNPFENQKPIAGIKKIVVVGSGKGGVGKSTVSSNLAVSLSEMGQTVGLLDADIYGPSLPLLFGCSGQKPIINDDEKITPLQRFGVKLMSMGFLIEDDQPVVWRGPMLFKAIDQFLNDVAWGELDTLIVDLPPGTGDIAITLAQKVPIDSAVVVTTPQSLSLGEVKKAVMMFRQLGVPVKVGVQNMDGLELPNGEKINLFPSGNMSEVRETYGIPNLVSIPFEPTIGKNAEAGIPFIKTTKGDSVAAQAFKNLAEFF